MPRRLARASRGVLLVVLLGGGLFPAGCGGPCGDLWYVDLDGDGFGDPARAWTACDPPEGMVANGRDCDDLDPSIRPGAIERCNGEDDDCDGQVDEDLRATWYLDVDADGYGDSFASIDTCAPPHDYVIDGGDCDDTSPTVHPGAAERCNDVDDDCNGMVDDDPVDPRTWYRDADDDSFGDPDVSVLRCDPPPGWVADANDCDDGDARVHPAAHEICNGLDDNCDGQIDPACG